MQRIKTQNIDGSTQIQRNFMCKDAIFKRNKQENSDSCS